MYDPIIPPICAYHQKFSSVGGCMNFQMSLAANATPITPKTIATTLNCTQTGLGRTMLSTISATLPSNASTAAAQSMALGPCPCSGLLRDQHPISAKRKIEAEGRDERQKQDRTPQRQHHRRGCHYRHCPEVDLAP